MQDDFDRFSDATLSIHAGDKTRASGEPLSPAPVMSTSFFTHPDSIGFSATDLAENAPHFYSRWSNPTTELLERRLAALEQGEAALTFASGMASISALFFDRLKAGDHLIVSDVCYAGVKELTFDTLPAYGIEVSHVDTSNPEAVADAIRKNTRLIHIETPANPILKLTDIAAIAQLAHQHGAELSVDSTIATPLGTKPLLLGADYVVHSLTKYLSGHGDVLAGAIISRAENIARLRQHNLIHMGGCLAPFSAWMVLRGLETLSPRMALHEANARRLEEALANHPRVQSVYWPGSPRHPQHELARKQMKNFSGLLSFVIKNHSHQLSREMAERLKVFSYAVSLGHTRSLIYYIPTEDILRSSFRLNDEAAKTYRDWAGDGVFRVSVGLEEADDLIADLENVL